MARRSFCLERQRGCQGGARGVGSRCDDPVSTPSLGLRPVWLTWAQVLSFSELWFCIWETWALFLLCRIVKDGNSRTPRNCQPTLQGLMNCSHFSNGRQGDQVTEISLVFSWLPGFCILKAAVISVSLS